MAKVDIIIPIHNIPLSQLADCLTSVENQSFQDWVVWVVESSQSSKDGEAAYLIEGSDDRFNYFVQSEIGVSNARNQGVKAGSAPLVAFLDGDDTWDSDYLEKMVASLDSRPVQGAWGVCYSPITFHSPLKGGKQEGKLVWSPYDSVERFEPTRLYYYFMVKAIYPSSLVVSRPAFEQIGGFDEEIMSCEDTDFVMRLAKDYALCHVPSALVKRTTSVESTKTNYEIEKWTGWLIDAYPWPSLDSKPDDSDEEWWEWMVDYITLDNHKPAEIVLA